jgi:hypothetical protein
MGHLNCAYLKLSDPIMAVGDTQEAAEKADLPFARLKQRRSWMQLWPKRRSSSRKQTNRRKKHDKDRVRRSSKNYGRPAEGKNKRQRSRLAFLPLARKRFFDV